MKIWIALLLALAMPFAALANEEPAEGEEGKEGDKAKKISYINLVPALVGNYGTGNKLKYFKADVSLRVTGENEAKSVEYHEPLIRNQLIMLFAQQTDEMVGSVEGKEALRLEALKQVREVLEVEDGKPLVDDLLFNNLIIQP